METQLPIGTGRDWAAGQGLKGGGLVQGIVEEGLNIEGKNHRVYTGALESRQGHQMGDDPTCDEAAEMSSWHRAAGSKGIWGAG